MASRVIIVEKRALNAHSIQAAEDESFAMESHQAPLRHAVLPSFLSSFFSLLSLSLSLFSRYLLSFLSSMVVARIGWLVGSVVPATPFRFAKRSRFRLSLVFEDGSDSI